MALRTVAGRHIEIVERGAGRPVLFMHGYPLDHRDLLLAIDPIFERRTGYRRIHLDLPGFGGSPPDPAIASSADMVEVIEALLDELVGDTPVILVAASWGGYLARGLLARSRERVAAVALLVPMMLDHGSRDLDPFRVLVPPAGPLEGGTPGWQQDFLESSVVAGDPQWRHYRDAIAPAMDGADPATLERIDAAYGFPDDIDALGRPLAIPALVIVGRQDQQVGYRDQLRLIERFPRATIAILDTAGHPAYVDRPVVVEALMEDWLDRVEGRPGEPV